MIRIAICDDNASEIEKIEVALKKFLSQKTPSEVSEEVCFQSFGNSFELLGVIEQSNVFDVLLLDICMPGVLGTELARVARKNTNATEIIFLTTSDEFAVDAFALKATHYLLKPFSQEEFDEALSRAMEHLAKKRNKYFVVCSENGKVNSVELNEIMYIESYGHLQNIFLKGEGLVTETKRSSAHLLEELQKVASGQFISTYKGYIVNQKQIRSVETDQIILKNGKSLPISKRNSRQVRDNFFKFMFSVNNV